MRDASHHPMTWVSFGICVWFAVWHSHLNLVSLLVFRSFELSRLLDSSFSSSCTQHLNVHLLPVLTRSFYFGYRLSSEHANILITHQIIITGSKEHDGLGYCNPLNRFAAPFNRFVSQIISNLLNSKCLFFFYEEFCESVTSYEKQLCDYYELFFTG